jgi:hypothetical protein
MLLKHEKPLVLTSDKLAQKIVEETERTFPTKNMTWRFLSRAIGIFETQYGKQMALILIPPLRKKERLSPRLFVNNVEGDRVQVHLFFPLYGTVQQQDEILRILLVESGIDDGKFSVESAGILMEIVLPFIPVEVKYGKMNGNNGCGQRAFICPEEVVNVS